MASVYFPTPTPYSCDFGKGAFENCVNLKRAKIAACGISEGLFRNCSLLENIEIIDKVNRWSRLGHIIRKYAFYGCSSLKRIVIPSNFRMIGESAFEGCTQLEYITKEEDKDNSLQKAFESFDSSLKHRVESDLSHPFENPKLSKKENKTFENSVRLSAEAILNEFSSVQKQEFSYLYQVHIQSKAFKGCNIKRIFLDEICLEGEENFAHCNSLNTVCLRYTRDLISDNQPKIIDYTGHERPPKIDFSRTFEECNSLESIFIGFHTDHSGHKYVNVETGEDATSDEYWHNKFLLGSNKKIEKVEISTNTFSTPGSIGIRFTQTFKGCGNLVSVYIDSGKVLDYTFADCIKLKYLYPTFLLEGNYIFKNCRKISNFYTRVSAFHFLEGPRAQKDWSNPINETTFAESNLKVKLREHTKHGGSYEYFFYLVYST